MRLRLAIVMLAVLSFGLVLSYFILAPSRDDVPGKYVGTYFGGVETIVINPNGTFTQTFVLSVIGCISARTIILSQRV